MKDIDEKIGLWKVGDSVTCFHTHNESIEWVPPMSNWLGREMEVVEEADKFNPFVICQWNGCSQDYMWRYHVDWLSPYPDVELYKSKSLSEFLEEVL